MNKNLKNAISNNDINDRLDKEKKSIPYMFRFTYAKLLGIRL